jgi:hypothetical protein
MPRERLLSIAGLDAYMLLRYIKLCQRVCLFSGVLGTIILIPMYIYGDKAQVRIQDTPWPKAPLSVTELTFYLSHKEDQHWNAAFVLQHPSVLSISNLKNPKALWVPIIFAYVTTAHVLYLLNSEYKRFLELRLTHLSLGDPDTDAQKNFTVHVDRIPQQYRSNVALFNLFDEIFPQQVRVCVCGRTYTRVRA